MAMFRAPRGLLRRAPLFGAAMLCVFAGACAEHGGGASRPEATATIAVASERTGPSLGEALAATEAGRATEGVEIVRAIGATSAWREELLAFDVREAQYASWGDDEREARSPAILARATALRSLGRSLLEEARRLVIAGRVAEAREVLEAMEKLGEANGDPRLVQMGRLAGDTIKYQAKRELESLAAGKSTDPSP